MRVTACYLQDMDIVCVPNKRVTYYVNGTERTLDMRFNRGSKNATIQRRIQNETGTPAELVLIVNVESI